LTRKEFAEKWGPTILEVSQGSGIIPALVLCQAILESSGKVNGKYLPAASKLAREANNYFGIKAFKSWKGKVYEIETKEQDKNGKIYIVKAKFRAYSNPVESFKDYILFLLENSRYSKAGVFNAKTLKEQAQALQAAGYATDTKYSDLIVSIYNNIKTVLPAGFDKPTEIHPKIKILIQEKKNFASKYGTDGPESNVATKNNETPTFLIGLTALFLTLYLASKNE
jgi:flagellum-specific peptidoglycan hydrolase FlgJ